MPDTAGRAVWKYDIPMIIPMIRGFALKMPAGAEILAIQIQYESPRMWVLVSPRANLETRTFYLVGTGFELPPVDGLKYLGTFQISGGALVFHLFEGSAAMKSDTGAVASDAADRLVAEIGRIPAVTERLEKTTADLRQTLEAGAKR